MNIIERLYNGNIRPFAEKIDYENDCEKAVNDLLDSEKSLTDFLNYLPNATKEKKLLLQLIRSQDELGRYIETQRFICGFRLGARFVLDTFVVTQEEEVNP